MPTFHDLPLWLNALSFTLAAAAVWMAGTRLSGHADAIADQTGLGKAFVGLVLLAGSTSLPELATTATAAVGGNARLAITNVFGGVAMQTAVLAVADATLARGALTYFAPRAVLLLEGNVLLVLLALTTAGIALGEVVSIGGVGLWPVLLFAVYLLGLRVLQRHEGEGRWQPIDPPREVVGEPARRERYGDWSLRRLGAAFGAASAVVFVAGATLAQAADALAVQSGLGASFVGASLLAASTSLPELSTTLAAVRMGSYAMAISNIFGSNMIMIALLLPADVLYREGPILDAVDDAAVFTVAVGMAVTALYLIGMLERRDRTFLRMGLDSLGVLALYVASLVGLWTLR